MQTQQVDALDWVKRSEALFFPGGKIDAMRLLAYVVSDVLELGRGDCRIASREGWWLIASDADWLVHHEFAVRELFDRVVPAPQHGEHSLRAEILLQVFAADVFTSCTTEAQCIKGAHPPTAMIAEALHEGWTRRLLVFRLAP